jgi:hypothetical protein
VPVFHATSIPIDGSSYAINYQWFAEVEKRAERVPGSLMIWSQLLTQ